MFFVPSAGAQVKGGGLMTPPPPPTVMDKPIASNDQGGILRVTVLTDANARLDRQSVVQLHRESPATTIYQTTKNDSETTFVGLLMGKYNVEVSAVGYLSAQKEIEIIGLTQSLQVAVTLQRDATAINLDAAGTADALMPAKASKDTAAAVAALKSFNLKEAHKRLNSAYKIVPESGRVNFLMGFLFFQERDMEQAKTYLNQAIALSPSDAQALALLGRIQFLQEQYESARASLERAVIASPGDWMSHNLLGSAYLKLKQYEKAREQAQIALDQGKADATSARLVLGEAQAYLGHTEEGIQTLKAFLAAAPASPQASPVKDFIAELERRAASTPTQAAMTVVQVPAVVTVRDPLFDLSELSIAWQPPGIDEAKPSVAAGVSCPTEQVLQNAGDRVEELVNDVGRFAAIEDMLHERLDNLGNPVTRETRKFDYAAYISQPRTGVLLVDEFRSERYGIDNLPDQIATSGFPALALVFHPSMQGDYEISCEGLGEWHGQATWLMHFRAREDRPSHMQDYVVGKNVYSIRMKGRAWITADKFQIVRIESELINPLKEIGFMAEHQIAEYGPVMFDKKNVELWLPKTAEVYLDVHRHRYYHRHSFDKYMLFSVDSKEKVDTAKQAPPGPGSTSPHQRKHWHA
jgi:tetratricopeptide (TPR) repeat protein